MKVKKIIASLSALYILGNVVAFDFDKSHTNSFTAYAETIDSGTFGKNFSWELDDAGILKISGSGEILDWTWVYNPRVYGQCRIKDVIIGKGIKKIGYVDYSPYGLENITILDPECKICETSDNTDPTVSNIISNVRYGGCIHGYKDSSAQAYAEKHRFTFKEIDPSSFRKAGDVNCDDEFNIADIVLVQKWLIAVPNTKLADWKAGDFCNDDVLDVFDLCAMKREYLKNCS